SCSTGSPRSSSKRACAGCCPPSDGSPSLRRHIGVFAAIVFFAAALAVPAAQAQRHMLIGMQDDAMALRGSPDFTFGTMKQLRVQGVHFTNFADEKVACGVTGPRGNNQARSSRPSMSPLMFMKATRKAGLKNLDAYAHNPYYGRPSETPTSRPGGSAITLGNINAL